MADNIITAVFAEGENKVVLSGLWQWDYGQILRIEGLDLPTVTEVHFAQNGASLTKLGPTTEGVCSVEIPNAMLRTMSQITAYIYLHTGEDDGETVYRGQINVVKRAAPTHETPTPVQQSEITQAIAALDAAAAQTAQDVIDTGQAKTDAQAAKQAAETAQSGAEDAEREAKAARDLAITAESNAAESARQADGSAQTAAQKAGESAASAEDSERSAERAEQAAANAGFMWVEMDENGHLIYTRTDAVDVDLELD